MKILHLNYSDTQGGAARAVTRIHQSQLDVGIDSHLHVQQIQNDTNENICGPSFLDFIYHRLRAQVSRLLVKSLNTQNPIRHSPAIFPSLWPSKINKSDFDIVNLHWVANEMLSISDVAKIKKPIVWNAHDMWLFCGAEHVTEDTRWVDGYRLDNRPSGEMGFDLNRWTWQRKRKIFGDKEINFIAPSQWIARCIKSSPLFHNPKVNVIPNCLDTSFWHPVDQHEARRFLGLPLGVPLIGFGTFHSNHYDFKGFGELKKTLELLSKQYSDLELVVFGQKKGPERIANFKVNYVGYISDDNILKQIYGAVDLIVMPSRIEAFGQVASEAQSCGKPVVAFRTGGLSDIIEHRKTGYLAEPFYPEDLLEGIKWILEQLDVINNHAVADASLGSYARERAISQYSYNVCAKDYFELYSKILTG